MKVLETYILKRVSTQAAGAVFASLAIVWTTQALTRVNLVTDSGASAGAFLLLATLLLPAIVPLVIPFAVLIASTQTLNGMNTDSELPVIHAAGTSRMTVFKPFIILMLIASVAVAIFGNVIEPYARQQARVLVAEARANFISLLIQENTFKRIDENLYMQIGERLPGGKLGGMFIADSRDPKQDLIYYARQGAIVQDEKQNLLVMNEGEIHSRTPETGALSVIKFDSYAFDLTEFTAKASKITLLPKDQNTLYLINPDPNDKVFQQQPHRYLLEFNKRLSEWMYVPALGLLSLVLSGMPRSHRGDAVMHTFATISLAIVVRWIGILIESAAENIAWMWPLVHVTPVIVILACIFALAAAGRQTHSRIQTRFFDLVAASTTWFQEKASSLLANVRKRVRP